MRQAIKCIKCKTYGYANPGTWYRDKLLLAIDPNKRQGQKTWICRSCINDLAKLSDTDFIKAIDKLTQPKPQHQAGSTRKPHRAKR